jgi:bifunctional ADP-heptose synthase (sugar kinase/adenylyltransferase)
LINAHLNTFAPETEAWLRDFRARHSLDEIEGYLARTADLRTLVIGEPIVDEYVFCSPLGKSSKDPILAFQYSSTESHAGGTLAIANHLAGMVGEVGLLAEIGDIERREDFMLRHLQPRVRPRFLTRSGTPTIHKRRFLDKHTGNRLIELYVMDDAVRAPGTELPLRNAIEEWAPEFDVVVVADYGHGMMTADAMDTVQRHARFLALNVQSNAGNRGYNLVSKYRRANYVCLAAHEVELEGRLRHAELLQLMGVMRGCIEAEKFTITRGHAGSVHFGRADAPVEVPAFATHVTDRVGAGDAVLAVTSVLHAVGAPADVIGFVGNIAGGIMCAELGNRYAITRPALRKAVAALMK